MAAGQFGEYRTPEGDASGHWRAVLEVSEYASPEEIRRAYRRAVKQVHPDLHRDDATAAAHFRGLKEAYEALLVRPRWSSMSRYTDVGEEEF